VSQENVDLVRLTWEFTARAGEPDFQRLHPDIVWHMREDLPDSRTYRGHDALAKVWAEWFESFDGFRVDIEELVDAGNSVIAVLTVRGRIKGSSEEVEMPEAQVWKIVDGKAVEVREYPTSAEARKAIGLE
jgi:ketosteroid isomerase-like protein